MGKTFLFLSIFLIALQLAGQNPAKKTLDHPDFDTWKSIERPQLSSDGRWVCYEVTPGEGDAVLHLFDGLNNKTVSFERGQNAAISSDSRFLVFSIKPHTDSLKAMRRLKVKKESLPKDSLGIFNLATGELKKIPQVKSFKLPEKWSGWLAYQVEPGRKDSLTAEKTFLTTKKKENDKTGSPLVFRQLETGREIAVGYVRSYLFAEESPRVLIHSTGDDTTFHSGVYLFETASANLMPLWRGKGEFKNLAFHKNGEQAAFLADLDTTKAQIRPYGLFHWQAGPDSARLVLRAGHSFLPDNWIVSEYATPQFSDDGSRVFFGIAPFPVLADTSLLEEEIVQVEVWKYDDPLFYTQQEAQLDREKRRSYLSVFFPGDGKLVQLGSEALPEIRSGAKGDAPFALGYDEKPYQLEASWEGGPTCRDVYMVDVRTGNSRKIAEKVCGFAQFSPSAQYLYWYSSPDSVWMAYSLKEDRIRQITDQTTTPFFDELNDEPTHPSPYGTAGWMENDASVLLYDRYDIWKVDPTGKTPPENLTGQRSRKRVLRYISLDPEKQFLQPDERILLHQFDETSKKEGYAWLDLNNGSLSSLVEDQFAFSRRPEKAKNAERYLFTKENFQTFPDLLYSPDLRSARRISDANPQQAEYSWGTIELYEWTAADGQKLQGLLVKPENFDPNRKYPMIVNFYDRSSNTLHRYRGPEPNRSQITYAFYASRGYVIFNPDVPYRIGYPGESAFNSVVSGVASLIDEGFVDKDRIGIQGHSWGGYQIAYLLTKTNMFRCAEAGAPVVNMFSAYGGVRWESGLSRMFQYERAQSRIGGPIWEYPLRYLENSPLFSIDKIQTPVLILHNDNDGAVPWYQGIEFFTAMRRLGKPAWLLNYNGEPHWPVKRQNRKDFQLRMAQFFDHFLQDAPAPRWMERGVPPMEKGILQGYELDGKKG